MEKVFGPFDGFHVAVYVRDLGNLGTSFLGHYKICTSAPTDFFSADFVRSKCVEGISATREEAQQIALELARLQIAGLKRQLKAAARANVPAPRQFVHQYQPTVPCPL